MICSLLYTFFKYFQTYIYLLHSAHLPRPLPLAFVLKAVEDDDTPGIREGYSSARAVRRVQQKRDGYVKLWKTISPLVKEESTPGYPEKRGFIAK